MTSEGARRPISRFEIRLDVPRIGDDDPVYPVARILVDGRDVLAGASKCGYAGWPAQMILTDDAPLLPADPPRRVIVYAEATDPAGLAPVISAEGDVVVWSDFQSVFEVGDDPLDQSDIYSTSPVELPDLAFDARQYAAEVHRATAEREWESDRWRTAVCLHDYLRPQPWALGEKWNVGFIEPDASMADRFLVTCWDDYLDEVIVVALTAGPGGTRDKARRMADFLLATPADCWPIVRRSFWSGPGCQLAALPVA